MLRLSWRTNANRIQPIYERFRAQDGFCDVTLICAADSGEPAPSDDAEPYSIRAHRVILGACSERLGAILGEQERRNGGRDPVVQLGGYRYAHMRALVQLIYTGGAQIAESDLLAVQKIARELLIRGIRHERLLPPATGDGPPDVAPKRKRGRPCKPKAEPKPKPERKVRAPAVSQRATRQRTAERAVSIPVAPAMPPMAIGVWTPAPQTETPVAPAISAALLRHRRTPKVAPKKRHLAALSTALEPHWASDGRASPVCLTEREREYWSDVVPLDDYLKHSTRQDFWDEPTVVDVLRAVHSDELAMRKAACILGVRFATLYSHFCEMFSPQPDAK